MEFVCQFDVREILGQGSFCEVKRCIDKRTRQAFAVKEMIYDTDELRERIEQEIEILQEVNHHNVLKLQHSYPAFNKYYLVMELACGGELFEDLVSRNAFSESTAREVMFQLFSAVQYIHGLRIVHRNIRPEKLILAWKSAENNVHFPPLKLTGFSLAKKLPEHSDLISCPIEGSPLYLAPETITKQPIGREVDIWACAVIFYTMLAGYPPFWSTNREELYSLIARGKYSFPDQEWKSISEGAKRLIKSMFMVDRNERATAAEVVKDPWTQNRKLSTAHRKGTLDHLNAFNAKRKLRGAVYTIFAMKRMMENPESPALMNGVKS